ncbi:MAG: hypothetical protein M1820_001048 [Bogoriella megaspora]|nr:MAG: hypothetical protein M1820_001048 [Bogoriella megaspora]
MPWFESPDPAPLKGKVVVVTGGALGIGASLVELLYTSGAHVFFGDVLDESAAQLIERLTDIKSPSEDIPRLAFVRTDVSSYEDNLRLFDAAYSNCGKVDHAVAAAGIGGKGLLCDEHLTLESVKEPISTVGVDVNLKGPIYFCRIGSVYLRQRGESEATISGPADQKSITLISSVAGFTEAPGIEMYTASKHGVLGLVRALRPTLAKSSPQPIRINAICPWYTQTRMARNVQDHWLKAGLPVNQPMDVARIIAGAMIDATLNGAALFISGGKAWDIEKGIDDLQPQWLGEENSRAMAKGQELLGDGKMWVTGKRN